MVQDPEVGAATPFAEVTRQVAMLEEVLEASGHEVGSLKRVVILGYGGERPLDPIEAFRDCAGRYATLRFDTIAVLWPRGTDAGARLRTLEAALGEGDG